MNINTRKTRNRLVLNSFAYCFSLLLFSGFLSSTNAFSSNSNPASSTLSHTPNHVSSSTTISVEDDSGSTVILKNPAKRIIALAPHIVENIYSAGAGDLLVASVNYADYPTTAQSLPKVGGYNTFNIESIVALKPDIIFAWQSGTPDHFIAKLKQLGIPLYLDEPNTIEEVATSIRNIGILTGKQVIAEQSALKHLKDLDKLKKTQTKKTPVTVFYQVWDDPLYTINGKQIISDVLSLCGGVNVYADESIKAPIISLESLLERDPEVIITGSTHKSSDQALGRWKKWTSMTAVKHDNLFVVNADIISRHTVRIIQGAESVCEKFDLARQNLNS